MEERIILHRLPDPLINQILQQVYQELPELLERIAPQGWQATDYHQLMQEERREIHQDFIQDLSANNRKATNDIAIIDIDDDAFTFENYFAITFPPMDNAHMEIFYIIAHHLLDITAGSVLYRSDTVDTFYIAEDMVIEQLIEIAYEHQEIDDLVRDTQACILSTPYLQCIDAIHIYEFLFSILRKTGYQLKYIDLELLYIAELQEMYQDMRYTLMSADEKTKNMRQLEQDILNVIHNNTHKNYHLDIDPLDLHTIVTLMNNHKTDPIILAYLHSYDTFPLGYPYKVSDYAGDDELLD